jgi:hypothetical protein
MRLRPDSAEMIEGETNRLVFNLAPLVGANTFSSTPTVTCSDLTFSGTAASGTTVSTFVSGGQAGKDYIVKISAILSSGETKVGAIRLEWKAPGYDSRTAA